MLLQNMQWTRLEQHGIILLACVLGVFIFNFIIKRVFKRFDIVKTESDAVTLPKFALLAYAVVKPLQWYLWYLVVFYVAYIVLNDVMHLAHDDGLDQVSVIVTLAALLWVVCRFIKGVEFFYIQKLPKKSKHRSLEVSGIKALSRLSQVGVLLIFILIVMGVLAVPISGLVTVGGVGGIAIAYAGKDILSNFLGGVMIYANRQFAIGDWIHSPDRDIEGVVEAMDWRFTSIRRFDKQLLYVPNSLFSTVLLINASRMSHRRIRQVVGVRYNDIAKVPAIFKDLRKVLESNEAFDQNLGVQINLTEFAASSVNFLVVAYLISTDAGDLYQAQDALLLKVAEIVEKHGAECAFPTLTLDVPGKSIVI